MLQDKDAMATVAVKDIETARKFYEGTWFKDPDGNIHALVSRVDGRIAERRA